MALKTFAKVLNYQITSDGLQAICVSKYKDPININFSPKKRQTNKTHTVTINFPDNAKTGEIYTSNLHIIMQILWCKNGSAQDQKIEGVFG
jgi:hypothetical protein